MTDEFKTPERAPLPQQRNVKEANMLTLLRKVVSANLLNDLQ